MKKFLLVFLIFSFFSLSFFYGNGGKGNGNYQIDNFLLSLLPGGIFTNSSFENFFPTSTFLVEDSNGFSFLDLNKVYFEGESPLNFKFYIEDFCANSALNPGTSSILAPLLNIYDYQLRTSDNLKVGFNLNISKNVNLNRFYFSSVYTDLGSFPEFATSLMNKHPSTRDDELYYTRRKLLTNNIIGFSKKLDLNTSDLFISFSYANLKRQFNDFSKEKDSTFNERGELFSFLSIYKKSFDNSDLKIITALNKRFRDHLNSEFGRLSSETFGNSSFSFLTGFVFKGENYFIKNSFLYEDENRIPNFSYYKKNMMDNDGDAIYFFDRFGKFRAFTVSIEGEKRFDFNNNFNLSIFSMNRLAFIKGNEGNYEDSLLLFDDTPLYQVRWNRGDKYSNTNTQLLLGAAFNYIPTDFLRLQGRLYVKTSLLGFENAGNNLSLWGGAFDIKAIFFKGRRAEFSVYYSQRPQDINETLNFFLESKRPSGIFYNMRGESISYTGGFYHSVSSDIKTPYEKRFIVSSIINLSKVFRVKVRGLYVQFLNNLWVNYEKYDGYYKKVDAFNLYFPEKASHYYLSNYNFDKNPFYAEFMFHLFGRKEKRWFFSFSFMAHMGMGYTAFGNGPVYNDIGYTDESMANPNTWINGYGRVDGDRAFVGRILFGFYLTKDLSLGANIKYRDGEPFAFIKYYIDNGKLALYYLNIQAEDERGVKGGPREDCIWDMSFKVNYSFEFGKRKANIFLSFFNILDIGAELSEYVFTPDKRNAVELQIPRSLRFGLEYIF